MSDRSVSPEPLAAGARVGPFILKQRLRSGPRAETWRASIEPGGLSARVEIVALSGAGRAAVLERTQALQGLQHPNLARVLTTHAADGRVVVALEPVDGIDLATLLVREGRLPLPAAAAVAGPILRGLRNLHRAGLWLGGLRSEEVWVDEMGQVRIEGFDDYATTDGPTTRGASIDRSVAASLVFGLLAEPGFHRGDEGADGLESELDVALWRAVRATDEDQVSALAQLEELLFRACRPEDLRPLVARALEERRWASTDDPTHPQSVVRVDDPTEPGLALPAEATLGDEGPSILEPVTLEEDDDALSIPTVQVRSDPGPGVVPSATLPSQETATEVDTRGPASWLEDPATVSVLDAFQETPHPGAETTTPVDDVPRTAAYTPAPPDPSVTEDMGALDDATPADGLPPLDGMRVPSRSEILAAIQGVPTLALVREVPHPRALEEGIDDPRIEPVSDKTAVVTPERGGRTGDRAGSGPKRTSRPAAGPDSPVEPRRTPGARPKNAQRAEGEPSEGPRAAHPVDVLGPSRPMGPGPSDRAQVIEKTRAADPAASVELARRAVSARPRPAPPLGRDSARFSGVQRSPPAGSAIRRPAVRSASPTRAASDLRRLAALALALALAAAILATLLVVR